MNERTPMNGHERQAISHLMAFLAMCGEHGEYLRERLKDVPHGWRDWKLMMSVAAKLYDGLMETLPRRNLDYMAMLEACGECRIAMRGATRSGDFQMFNVKSVSEVIRRCIGAECEICVKDEAETKACKLRKALIDMTPPTEIPKFGCVFRDCEIHEYWGE